MRRYRGVPVVDVVIAAVLAVGLSAISARIPADHGGRPLDALGYVLIVVASGVLAGRWRWPMPVLVLCATALTLYAGIGYSGGPVYLTLLLAVYAVASTAPRQTSVVAAATATAAVILAGELVGVSGGWIHVVFVSWVAAAVILAEAAANRRAYLAGLEERARRLEETRDEEARRRVAEERLRIARDLHDIVAHSIASINVQAGVAAHVIDQRPAEAREALLAIKQASKEALDELRATLGLLRQGGDDRAPRAPAPGLDQIDGLVDVTRRAGVAVEVDVVGERRPLPPAVDVAAYRIVQEALTNVVRHAGPGAEVLIVLTFQPASVDIEVVDDGGGRVPAVVSGSTGNGAASGGHGLAGMRERATILGGRVEAHARPRPEHGFRVRATLPTRSVGE